VAKILIVAYGTDYQTRLFYGTSFKNIEECIRRILTAVSSWTENNKGREKWEEFSE